MVQPDRPVVRAPVDSVARVPVVVRVVLVEAPEVPVVARVPVVVRVVLVAVRVRQADVVRRAGVAVVVVRKSCSPVRFATPNRLRRSPRASSSSNAVCRPRSSRRV